MAFPLFAQGAFTSSPNDTPETIAQKRAFIAAMMPRFGSAKYVGEGLGQLATGVMVGRQNRKLNEAEGAGRKSAAELFDRLMSGAGGSSTSYSTSGGGTPSGTWTPAPPPPDPIDTLTTGMDVAKSGGLSFGADMPEPDLGLIGAGKEKLGFGSAVMTPQEMLIAGAEARGLNPVDVATAISYETGGKFDPMISGPTTQWGTHRGLIQFGEPQAQQYGVDFSSPDAAWQSQLNPTSGAVWSYLDGAGVRPGMGLDQIYSAINAGSVGRMGASDANNGGAPGTVADKVASMGPHREKAAQFLGGTWTPDPNYQGGATTTVSTKGGGIPMNDLLAALSNPWLDQSQRAILTGIYEQQQQQADPMYQMQMRKAELELAQLENPTQQAPEEFTTRMFTLNSLGIDPQSEEGKVYLMTGKLPEPPEPGFTQLTPEEVAQLGLPPGVYQRGPKGEIKQIGGGGQTINVNTGSEVGTIPQGFELFTDPATGARSMRPIPGGPEDTTKKDEKKAANAETAASVVTTAAERALAAARDRALGGFGQGIISAINPYSDSREVDRQVEVLKANAKVDNLQAMRDASPTGGALGSVTEGETQMLAAKSGALDPSSPNFERDLADYTRTLLRVVHGPEEGDRIFTATWKGEMPDGVAPQPASADAPAVGTVEDGWEYIGGDPAQPESWRKVQ